VAVGPIFEARRCVIITLTSVFEDENNGYVASTTMQSGRLLHRQQPPHVQSPAVLPTSSVLYPVTPHPLRAPGTAAAGMQECAGCGCVISERYLLRALDRFWHEDCLKCSCCDCRLGEVGSTLFTKANLLLCRRDYLR